MKTTILAATLGACLAGFIMATPAPAPEVGPAQIVSRRQWAPHIYACITTGWQHYSVLDANKGQCYFLGKGDDFFESITGFGPDQGLSCYLYR